MAVNIMHNPGQQAAPAHDLPQNVQSNWINGNAFRTGIAKACAIGPNTRNNWLPRPLWHSDHAQTEPLWRGCGGHSNYGIDALGNPL